MKLAYDDFFQLSAFFKERLVELRSTDQTGLQVGDDIVGNTTGEVTTFVEITRSVLEKLNSPRTKQLFLIKNSPK